MNNGSLPLGRGSLVRYAEELSSRVAQHRSGYEATDSSALLFRIGPELFALPTLAIREVVASTPIHSIPGTQHQSILGLASIRGELVLCIGLERMLRGKLTSHLVSVTSRMVVLSWHGSLLGCPVDEVLRVHRFRKEHLRPIPASLASSRGLVLGILEIEGRVASILSADGIFGSLSETPEQATYPRQNR